VSTFSKIASSVGAAIDKRLKNKKQRSNLTKILFKNIFLQTLVVKLG
jgi:hypothetical protein